MRIIVGVIALIFFCLVACKKEHKTSEEKDLIIHQTNTAAHIPLGQPITSSVAYYYGPCDGLKGIEITPSSGTTFEIRIKGYRQPEGVIACADVIFSKDTTLSIPVTSKGQYILKFYNRNEVFKSDTVQVN